MSRPNVNLHGVEKIEVTEHEYDGVVWIYIDLDGFKLTLFGWTKKQFMEAVSDSAD